MPKSITVRILGEAIAVEVMEGCCPPHHHHYHHHLDYRIGPVREQQLTGRTGAQMPTLQLKDTQECVLGVEVRDKKGKVTTDPLDGPPTWRSSDESVATVTASDDGTSATVVAGEPGSCQINVSAVNEGQTFAGTLDLLVVAGDAAEISVTTGTPTEQP